MILGNIVRSLRTLLGIYWWWNVAEASLRTCRSCCDPPLLCTWVWTVPLTEIKQHIIKATLSLDSHTSNKVLGNLGVRSTPCKDLGKMKDLCMKINCNFFDNLWFRSTCQMLTMVIGNPANCKTRLPANVGIFSAFQNVKQSLTCCCSNCKCRKKMCKIGSKIEFFFPFFRKKTWILAKITIFWEIPLC